MIVDRYYYHQLNKQEQAIYKAFYNGAMVHQDIIPIPVRGEFSQESFERIFMAMTRDNPLIYFLNQSACSTASDMFGHVAICPQYFFTKEKVKEYKNIELVGIHAHIGSQIFEIKPFLDEVEIMLKLVKEVNENNIDINLTEVDLGGGIGVYYTKDDKPKTITEFCEAIINKADEVCEELNIKRPKLIIEPGRSLVANAGSTIYTIGSIKEIKNVRTYVSVDGGMTDNIRPSLYQAGYECAIVDKMNNEEGSHAREMSSRNAQQ